MKGPSESVEQDAGVFVGLVIHCFEVLGGHAPELMPASLEWALPPRLASTGYMAMHGGLEGWVALSLSDQVGQGMLQAMGESERGEAALLDLTAELAGVITSNARAHFGTRLEVEPPVATRTALLPDGLREPQVAFKLPFRWQGEDAFLLVAFVN